MKRGDEIVLCGGIIGRYVGTSKAGVQWICYNQDYAAMCKAFDEL